MKHFSIVLFMLGIMSSFFGTFIINRTITIDAVTLAATHDRLELCLSRLRLLRWVPACRRKVDYL